jgi:LPXTG-motif cell wall-anchored protein
VAYNDRNRLLRGRRLKMTDALSAMEYPHWIMVAGAILVALGFIGLVFRKNRNGPVNESSRVRETNAKTK